MKHLRLPKHQINRFLPNGQAQFLIVTPSFTHRSAGVRALYRLCHHLNRSGYPSAVIPMPGQSIADYSSWFVYGYAGEINNAVVIYPEIISGNPYEATHVVRWVLNEPGLLGGDKYYADNEIVFVYDSQKIDIANTAIKTAIGSNRVLWVGVVDPDIIYPDPRVEKIFDCSFFNKGYPLSLRFPLDPSLGVKRIEDLTPDAVSLGNVLRQTRTLYSYDHYSNILREAAICGCEVRVIDSKGVWHDPEHCDCQLNIVWSPDFRRTYKSQFHDSSIIHRFISQLPSSWPIHRRSWYRRLISALTREPFS
ncbi:MAG: hypothetical protein HOO86_01460 [Bacteroidales bacterium]|nr:hypothetical protein [Bacteroidales bacterium]